MKRAWMGTMLAAVVLVGCEDSNVLVPLDGPAAPRGLDASYYAGAVRVTWELAPGWDGEAFRIYSKRTSDADYFLIAEVTSCAAGLCRYEDRNVLAGQSYLYYVAAVDPGSGAETPTDEDVRIEVPQPVPPPVPTALEVIALDGANYLHWSNRSRDASDFAFYRVYVEGDQGDALLLGETDSEGFLDLLVQNGSTYRYFVASVDELGHESALSTGAAGTPRPDYRGEFIHDWFDRPLTSGFRFQADDGSDPIVSGSAASRHFRLEVDDTGWWLVPGPNSAVYANGFPTSALVCGPGADATCTDVARAPTTGYVTQDVSLEQRTSYVLRVRGDDGRNHYGVIRVELLGFDQGGTALMFFDWAYQLQPDNPALSPA